MKLAYPVTINQDNVVGLGPVLQYTGYFRLLL